MEDTKTNIKVSWLGYIKEYYKVITLLMLLCIITVFLLLLYKASVDTKIMNDFASYIKASDLSSTMKAAENVDTLDKLSSQKSVAGDFAKLRLAAYYFNLSQYNKAAYYYQQQYINGEFAEYAKMMAVISKRKAEKITVSDALENLSHTGEFGSVASVLKASILIAQNRKDEARIILDNSKLITSAHLVHIINLLLTNCV